MSVNAGNLALFRTANGTDTRTCTEQGEGGSPKRSAIHEYLRKKRHARTGNTKIPILKSDDFASMNYENAQAQEGVLPARKKHAGRKKARKAVIVAYLLLLLLQLELLLLQLLLNKYLCRRVRKEQVSETHFLLSPFRLQKMSHVLPKERARERQREGNRERLVRVCVWFGGGGGDRLAKNKGSNRTPPFLCHFLTCPHIQTARQRAPPPPAPPRPAPPSNPTPPTSTMISRHVHVYTYSTCMDCKCCGASAAACAACCAASNEAD